MRRPFRRRVVIAGLTLLAATASHANPDRVTRIIVPFGAGTITDALARSLGQALASVSKQSVIVENKSGAEGTIGTQGVLSAEADGQMLLFTSSSIVVLDPLLKKSIPYDPVKDLEPVCAVALIDNILNAGPSVTQRSVGDLVSAAKASPGKFTFAYLSATTRLAGELFAQSAGIQLTGVPYRTANVALTDVASGRVDMIFIDQASAGPFYQGGKIRPMLVAGASRLSSLPQVPAAAEVALAGYELQPWFAAYVPGRTPAPVLAKLRETLEQAVKTPAMVAMVQKAGLQEFPLCGAPLKKYQREDIQRVSDVVKKAQIEKL